jgi:hypothetical protein
MKFENIVGKFFLGKDPTRHVDYVWGRILRVCKGKVECGFFNWKQDAGESDFVRATVTPLGMNGWRFYSNTQDLNAAVADLSRSLATVAQYDCQTLHRRSKCQSS